MTPRKPTNRIKARKSQLIQTMVKSTESRRADFKPAIERSFRAFNDRISALRYPARLTHHQGVLPDLVAVDNGREFVSAEVEQTFAALLQRLNKPADPETDGGAAAEPTP